LQNLREGGFAGDLHLVNPHYAEIEGLRSVPRIEDLPSAVDVVIVATPAEDVPRILEGAGAKGCATAIVITTAMGHGPGSLGEAANQAARAHGLRIIGPNCLGVLSPRVKFNGSFAARLPRPGDLALVSQSGAIAAGLVEWATPRSIGFSAVVSLGDTVDVDFGDLLDFFASDRDTRAILLYVESLNNARKFMSAARATARIKPVVVIKSGRHAQGAKAAQTHTGALAGADAVYDAAFRRAGLLRVLDLDELFAAAETLGRLKPFPGKRLAVLTNGGGIGVLAVDRLSDLDGTLAVISPELRSRLDAILPPAWSRANPIDIIGDADGPRYANTLETLLADPGNDAILIMNVPTAMSSARDAAAAVAAVAQQQRRRLVATKPLFAVWIGDDGSAGASLDAAGIPHYATESEAVRGFMHLVRYREGLEALMRTPPSLPQDFVPDVAAARKIIDSALREGRTWLDPVEITGLLSAYVIPVTPALLARDPDEAARVAARFLDEGNAVVVKILSPDIVHKSEVGGVRLNLIDAHGVREAAADILARARAAKPEARIAGVTIHPMMLRPKARELIAGMADDPTFGPVIVFGRGGTAVEVINDKALALPPLDLELARDLIARTRVSRILKSYRDVPAADEAGVALVLVKLAQMAADFPEIREVDLNPLLADENGIIAVDARIAVAPLGQERRRHFGHPRFAIRPYPKEWERRATIQDGTAVLIRPVRPEDEPLYEPFFAAATGYDLRLRFFAPVKEFSHSFIARLTQLDYGRSMAFMALAEGSGTMLGVVHLHADANYQSAEYAILVRSDLKGRGLGWALMQTMIEYARSEGLQVVEGQVLRENTTMLDMCRNLNFDVRPSPEDHEIYVVKLAIT
jgi:acetyltransferase